MATILNIETSTQVCSVSLAVDGELKAIKESNKKNIHAEVITVFSEEVFKMAGLGFGQLDAIAVSMGPGSYTGLRIGVSTVKGFCYALDKPLIAINTLKSLAFGMVNEIRQKQMDVSDYLFCPMIDARRMEVYTALFTHDLEEVQETSAKIIDNTSFDDILQTNQIVFAGDGSEKCKSLLDSVENTFFLDDFFPSSKYLSALSYQSFQNQKFEDTAYFEPYYLKDFVAGIPKVKGLR